MALFVGDTWVDKVTKVFGEVKCFFNENLTYQTMDRSTFDVISLPSILVGEVTY